MKIILNASFLVAILMLSFASALSQTSVTIKDNNGNTHSLSTFGQEGTFHDGGNEIYLFALTDYNGGYLGGNGSWDGANGFSFASVINYWHAGTIHAGYNFSDFGFPGSTDNNAAAYKTRTSHEPFWDDGFLVWDGKESTWPHPDAHWTEDGGPPLFEPLPIDPSKSPLKWKLDGTSNSSGAVIFRADDQIILTDGFKVLYNPYSAGNFNLLPHTITNIEIDNDMVLVTTMDNHNYFDNPKSQQVQILSIDFNGGHDFEVIVKDPKSFWLKKTSRTNPVQLPSSTNFGVVQLSGYCADNAYFHAYTGEDRFSCTNLWKSSSDIDVDFTSNSTSLYPNDQNSKLKAMDFCTPVGIGGAYDPGHAILNGALNDPLVLTFSSNNTGYHCGNDPNPAYCPGGVYSGNMNSGNLYSLKYGVAEFNVKFPSKSTHKPALWSFHNVATDAPDGKGLSGSDEIDAVDCDAIWYLSTWDINSIWPSRVESVEISADGTGSGYVSNSTFEVTFTQGGGSGAIGMATTNSLGKITKVDMTDNGSGYTSIPTPVFSAGGGTDATGIVQLFKDDGEDEVYHYSVGAACKLPYANQLACTRGMFVSFTQIPNNNPVDESINSNLYESFSDKFHVYSYEWLPGEVRFMLADENGNNKVEVGRTTRYVPTNFGTNIPENYGMNIIAANQNREYPSTQVTSDILVRSIKVTPLNPIDPCHSISNKRSSTDDKKIQNSSLPDGISISSITPNPAQDKISFVVKFEGENISDNPLKIELYSPLGQLISNLFDGVSHGANSTYSFSTEKIASGKYYVRVSSGSQRASKAVLILH